MQETGSRKQEKVQTYLYYSLFISSFLFMSLHTWSSYFISLIQRQLICKAININCWKNLNNLKVLLKVKVKVSVPTKSIVRSEIFTKNHAFLVQYTKWRNLANELHRKKVPEQVFVVFWKEIRVFGTGYEFLLKEMIFVKLNVFLANQIIF